MCLYYDYSLQLLRVAGIVLMQRSLHIHPDHWQLSHSAGHIELTWVQNGPVLFEKVLKTTAYSLNKDNFASGDFIEQIEKLVDIGSLYQCFSNFVRPRNGKFFFYKTRTRSQQIYS
jgi:uncharacterized protein YijF (DUF1287 family)